MMFGSYYGELIQLLGVIVTSVGIGIEIGTGAHAGYLLITAGSVAFAAGTKLKGR